MLVDVFLHGTSHTMRDLELSSQIYVISCMWWVQLQIFNITSIAEFPICTRKCRIMSQTPLLVNLPALT